MDDHPAVATAMKSGGQLIAAQVAASMFGILTTGFLARTLSKEALALIPVAVALALIVQLANNLGLPSTCVRLLPELLAKGDVDLAGSITRSALLLQIAMTLPILFFLIVGSDWIALILLESRDAAPSIIRMVPFILLLSVSQTLGLMMQGAGLFPGLSAGLLISNVAQQMAVPPAYLLGGMPAVLLVALPIGPLVQVVMFTRALSSLVCGGRSFYPLHPLVSLSLPYYAATVMRYFGNGADQLLVALLFPPEHIATYYVASRLSQPLVSVVTNLCSPLMTLIGQTKAAGMTALSDLLKSVTRYYGYVAIPLTIGMAVMAHPIVDLAAGGEYQAAGWILVVQALGAIGFGAYSISGANVFYLTEPVNQLKLQSLNGFLSTGLEIVLGLALGTLGFAVGNLLGYAGAAVYGVRLLRGRIDVQVDSQALRRVSTAMLPMLVAALMPQALGWGTAAVWVLFGLGALVSLILLVCWLEIADIQVFKGIAPASIQSLVVKATHAMRWATRRTG